MNKPDLSKQFTLESGLLIVVSGPSGTGKSALCQKYLKDYPNTALSISETTRAPRGKEQNGVEYTFISETLFEERADTDYYLEHAGVYNKHYGTPRHHVLGLLKQGRDVILEIDPQGAEQIRKNFPDAISVFILPPSYDKLEERIRGRKTETEEQITLRLSSALREIDKAAHYDYAIVNRENKLEEAVQNLRSIAEAERLKISRLKGFNEEKA